MDLDIQVFKPGNTITPHGEPEIIIYYLPTDQALGQCNHS